jgi:anaerobic ribonucleoside-triphosphate reductase activating protein
MLKIGKYLISQNVNGPGKRFVIWFQGCTIQCKGCFNSKFWDVNGGEFMEVEKIFGLILNAHKNEKIEGVTFTGGEPLDQAKNIIPLARKIKSINLTIVCYTGYLFGEIINGIVPFGYELLKYVDILIDGKFIEEEKAPLLWRGSRNQKVYFLSNIYKYFEEIVDEEGKNEIEILIGDEIITSTGIIDLVFWEKLKQELKNRSKK